MGATREGPLVDRQQDRDRLVEVDALLVGLGELPDRVVAQRPVEALLGEQTLQPLPGLVGAAVTQRQPGELDGQLGRLAALLADRGEEVLDRAAEPLGEQCRDVVAGLSLAGLEQGDVARGEVRARELHLGEVRRLAQPP